MLIAVGLKYSIFTYTKQGETENTVTTGKLTFLYTENTGTNLNALAKYNLNVGNEVDIRIWNVTPLATITGIQDSA